MSAGIAVYQRREPEHGVLWQCVKEHLPACLATASENDRPVPEYVREELERFLRCGIVEEGCAVVRCGRCGFTRLVAFSCKGRGVCPSCIARRMSDTAAHLVDHVLPTVPMRQWVLSLPVPLRYLLAWDCELSAAVIGIFLDAVFRHLRQVAKRDLGLFVREGDWGVQFRALPEPAKGEIAAVAWDICERVVRLLRKRGQWVDAPAEKDRLAEREPLWAQLYTASITGTLVMGPRAGQRQMRVFGAAARDSEDGDKVRNAYGFDLDAAVRIPAHDRKRLEALARYMLRPPLSRSRLTRQSDGRYRVHLKRPWNDGTTHIVLDGAELIDRLAALVPPPRAHQTRYYGVFAPRHKLRSEVMPKPQLDTAMGSLCHHPPETERERQRRLFVVRVTREGVRDRCLGMSEVSLADAAGRVGNEA